MILITNQLPSYSRIETSGGRTGGETHKRGFKAPFMFLTQCSKRLINDELIFSTF